MPATGSSAKGTSVSHANASRIAGNDETHTASSARARGSSAPGGISTGIDGSTALARSDANADPVSAAGPAGSYGVVTSGRNDHPHACAIDNFDAVRRDTASPPRAG